MLLLASSSPRRQELLRNARILHTIHPADIPEIRNVGEAPAQFAQRMARDKARAVYSALRPSPGTFVLGADTVVVVDDDVFGKPADEQDASRMLRRLSGRTHVVITGICLCGVRTGQSEVFEEVKSESTRVVILPLSDDEINDYVATGEPLDKAGAYAIQGLASRWIPRIEGDYFNVVGLPVASVCRLLREHGGV
jgi:septum formation protein